MLANRIRITSEIDPLQTVLLHRPGLEMERLSPDTLTESLFEDIPWLKKMQEEHDVFAEILRENNVEVLYLRDLLLDIINNEDIKRDLIEDSIRMARPDSHFLQDALRDLLSSTQGDELLDLLIAGISKTEMEVPPAHSVESDKFFYLNPIPNLYFMRDPAAVIGNAVSINTMYAPSRRRESLLLDYLGSYHPYFDNTRLLNHYNAKHSIEGGDILVLSPEVLAIGWSLRTSVEAIKDLAKEIFSHLDGFKEILIFELPQSRAYIHLDTVFTMIDYDKFTLFPGIEHIVKIHNIRCENNTIRTDTLNGSLQNVLSRALDREITLVRCGENSPLTAAREQWNSGTNTLALKPGTVIAYGRNETCNAVMRDYGINVIEITGSELVRGRGGPRCMTMPLYR